uniref:Uncharacterized protein n=1 Tax=Panagrolaimus sp. JU765 TaxID=591449 RepID=A0AC34Q1T4_9BILA
MKLLVVLALVLGCTAFNYVKRDTAGLIHDKFDDLKEGCFPRGSLKGCTCTIKNADGTESVTKIDNDDDCKKPVEVQTKENKEKLNQEFKEKFGNLKENCFPRPGKGCRCTEKDEAGNEVTKNYDTPSECNAPARKKRGQVQSQNVRDPVREQAQQNYAAVVNELKQKFAGLREGSLGCYPRPRGCLCVTGKDHDGREITQRYMKDSDCKCAAGSPGCPAAAA